MNARAELGTDAELIALVEKIKGFAFDTATPAEMAALIQALKIVAADVTRKHEQVREMKDALAEKLQVASMASELSGVVTALRQPIEPRKPRWF